MKIRTISAVAGVTLALFAFAGEAAAQRPFRVGVIGGYNMASAWGDDAESADSRSGFDGGALVQIPMGSMITIQPEVHYSQRGYQIGDTETALDYITVPILLRAGLPLAEGFDFDFLVGPSLGFLMSCSTSVDDADDVECPDDDYESFDYGIVAGGGFSWAAGPGDVLVDVRYDLGMKSTDATEAERDIKNGNLQFLLGYAFPL